MDQRQPSGKSGEQAPLPNDPAVLPRGAVGEPLTAQSIEEMLAASMEEIHIELLHLHTPPISSAPTPCSPALPRYSLLEEGISLYRKKTTPTPRTSGRTQETKRP